MSLKANGVCYNIERVGTGEPPLVLLHGFTGSIKTWSAHFPSFAKTTGIIAIDLLGHGKSDAPGEPGRYTMECCAEDMSSILDELTVTRANILGYSMGGRVALGFAHKHPERVNALILESASPGIKDEVERQERMQRDSELADRIEREGVAKFVEYWTEIPLFASQARLTERVRENLKSQRLENSALGLANSLRGLSIGRQEPFWNDLPNLSTPTLLVSGVLDDKFSLIARRMSDMMPKGQLEVVEDAGHAVHLEQPARFDELVLKFLPGIGH